ncbi:AbiU2 domain-containing protein [Rhodocyclus tenuis]|uniref:AbiU2 domain-containing protein n=1 Tax=Rhodocyclus tenuis TaxID=1066 RepID=UPI00389B1DBC
MLASAPIAANADALASEALSSCEFARDWRNRRLAHRDLDLAVGINPEPLAPVSRASVKVAIASLGQLLNLVSRHYFDSTTMFDFRQGDTDAANLLYVIRDGLRYEEDRFARVKSGELPSSALKPDPL